jgi:hypothetical protein
LITVSEFYAGHLKSALNHVERCSPWLAYPSLKLMHGDDPYPSLLSEIVLTPSEQSPRCAALSRRKHWQNMPKASDSHNSIKFD